jgi:serine/threonine-protein kinase
VPTVARDLERVCLKCLEKDPTRRYNTAAELAQDLESWLDFRPISIRPESSAARAWRWCRTHPALATVVAGAAFVLAATAAVTTSIAQEYEQLRIRHILNANSYAAESKAGEVLAQLRELSNPLARCAADPRVANLLATPLDPQAQPSHADRLLVECGAKSVFDSVAIVSQKGDELARLPRRQGPPHSWRALHSDFFADVRELAGSGDRAIHVGKVIRPDDHNERYVSLSAPVFDADNRWLGLVHVMVQMTAFLESLRLLDSGNQMALLAGVEEPLPQSAVARPADDGGMVLLHDVLGSARIGASESTWLDELNVRRRAAGRNPFRTSEERKHSLEDNPTAHALTSFGQRWLAGFAPVGHTGYAVVVQTQYDGATEAVRRALWRLIGGSSAVLLLGASVVFALARTLQARIRARRV